MKQFYRVFAALLAMVWLCTACGNDVDTPVPEEETSGPSINYEDYVKPVVDRRVGDLITAEELSTIMSVEVLPVDTATTDDAITFQSENGYYMVTLALENRTRDEFDRMVSDTTVWTPLDGVGEVAYWGAEQAELVAFQSGYAVSVSGDHVIPGCLETIMKHLVDALQQ